MTLPALLLPPDQASYQTTIGETAVVTKLDGGASRFRADQLQVASNVAVQWDCNKVNYDYLMAFWRTAIQNGSLPFTLSLILDHGTLQAYTCRILPGSFGLDATQGQQYIVKATLEVAPLDPVPLAPNMRMDIGTFVTNADTAYDPGHTVGADFGSLARTHSSSLTGYFAPGTLVWTYDGTQLYRGPGGDDPTAIARTYIRKIFASVDAWWTTLVELLGLIEVSIDGGSTWHTITPTDPDITQDPQQYQLDLTAMIVALVGSIAAYDFNNIQIRASVSSSVTATWSPAATLEMENIGIVIAYVPGAPLPIKDDATLIAEGPDGL